MRLVIAAALALSPLSVVASQGVVTISLAPGEVLLELDATGISEDPADVITLYQPVVSRAATASEARRANTTLEQRLMAAVRAAGVAAGDVTIERPDENAFGFVGNEAVEMAEAAGMPEQPRLERSVLKIRVPSASRLEAIRSALEAAGAGDVPEPRYSLRDGTAARRAARAQAVAKARADADAYASTLGMRVARVVRVSERVAADAASMEMMQMMFRRMSGMGNVRPGSVETTVRVSVDFALVPAR